MSETSAKSATETLSETHAERTLTRYQMDHPYTVEASLSLVAISARVKRNRMPFPVIGEAYDFLLPEQARQLGKQLTAAARKAEAYQRKRLRVLAKLGMPKGVE